MGRHRIGTIEDVPAGESLGVRADGVEIAVFNLKGELYAVQNRCPHKRGPLYQGEINEDDCTIYCPWHYWEFNLESGNHVVDPRKGLRTFDVSVVDGEVWIEL